MRSWIKPAIALVLAAGLMSASVAPASAGHRNRGAGVAAGVAAGIIGLGILGAEAEAERQAYEGADCRPGPRECRTVERPCFHNDYGDYVCPAPERRCFRRQYCD
ncbi:MAG: hypothetical protein HY765_03755 [Rhodomicrobium sp.]|nr:hypothetical protein [Rhodomicrobium sp.]